MNFLNPFILYGLGAAVLPILIHLLFRRRLHEVAFPTLEFLDRLKTSRMRRLRMKQYLVLLIRMLIIMLLIFAFSRPVLHALFHRNSRTSAVIIVDGSASMRYIHHGEMLFDNAKRKALELVGMLDNKDSGAIILIGDTVEPVKVGLTTDTMRLNSRIHVLDCSWSHGDPTGGFALAAMILKSSQELNKEIFYITDGAKTALPDSFPITNNQVRLYTILVGPDKRKGPVIDHIELKNTFVSPGSPMTFRVHGTENSVSDFRESTNPSESDVDFEFFVNGERKGKIAAALGSQGYANTEFTFIPNLPEWYSISATVGEEMINPGQTQRIAIQVPQTRHVLIVGENAEDMYYIEKALHPQIEDTIISVRRVMTTELSPSMIGDSDIVILAGVKELTPMVYASLVTAVVEHGTGLVVFMPTEIREPLYGDGIFRDLFPLVNRGQVKREVSEVNNTVIDLFTPLHPILKGIMTSGTFEKPIVRQYWRLNPQRKIETIARFSDGALAIGDARAGKGHIVLFCINATLESSDLPLTGIFAPLMVRLVQYLGNGEVIGMMFDSGSLLTGFSGTLPSQSSVAIKPEHGPARFVEVTETNEGFSILNECAGEPNFYSIIVNNTEWTRFAVNIPLSEIVFVRAGGKDYSEAFKEVKWKVLNETENVPEIVRRARFGTELFGIFILCALGLIILEMIVAKKA